MKKSLLLSITGITLVALTATTLYAQTTTGNSVISRMKAAVSAFTLAGDLNPGQTGLQSAPVSGKKTGDILTAGEWNRVLELVSGGGDGGVLSSCEVVSSPLGQESKAFCGAEQVRTGGGCKNDPNGAFMWRNYPIIGDDGRQGWFCSSGSTGTLTEAHAVCCSRSAASSGSGWVDVPLTGTENFDDSCMYRFQITYTSGGREPYVPKETHYYANGVSPAQLVWWLENDSVMSSYHIAASSKTLLRINGTPYTTGGVSVTKIEKLCGGGGLSGSGGFSSAFYYCTNAQSADANNAPCYGAKQNQGSGNGRYRTLVAHLSFPSYSPSNLSMFPWHDGTKWKCAVSGVGHFDCTDGSVLVADTQASGGGSSSGWSDIVLQGATSFDVNCEYRFKASAPGNTDDDAFIGDDNAFNYIQRVHANRLTYQHIGTAYEHINADTKTTLRQNGTPASPAQTITQIQKRCN